MKTYTTVQCDMWDSIAFSQLGDVKYTDVLQSVNTAYRKIFVFASGIVLNIPDVNTTVTTNDLPPWKRVIG